MPAPYYGAHAGDVIDEAIAKITGDFATPAAGRSYLELGDSATKNVGTTANTVMAGNDPRVANALVESDLGVTVCPLDSNGLVPPEHIPGGGPGGPVLLDSDELIPPEYLPGLYRTFWIGAEALVPRTTNGAATGTTESSSNKIMQETLDFDGATQEFAQTKFAMPDEWNRGTVKVKVYWTPKTGASAADVVEWGIKMGAFSNDDAIDAALGSEVTIGDTVIAVGDLHVTAATGAITVGGTPALGDLIWLQISRNPGSAGDDMTEDALLLGILIQYLEGGPASAW